MRRRPTCVLARVSVGSVSYPFWELYPFSCQIRLKSAAVYRSWKIFQLPKSVAVRIYRLTILEDDLCVGFRIRKSIERSVAKVSSRVCGRVSAVSSDRGDANTRAGGPCVHGLWLGGVSVSVRRASEERECVMSSEYERRWNNDSSEQSQKHPDPAGGGSSGWLSVVPARDSQGERRAIVSGKEDKKIGEDHSSSGDALPGGSSSRLGRCDEGETEGWMAASGRGRGGESPLETRRETHRGESNSGCEVCEAEENIERTCGVNSCPAVAQAGATADAHESRSMCVTSSTEGQIRTLPEPPLDGATYVPRVSSAAHIDPPDVADVEGVAPAGSAQGEGESPGGR